MESWQNKSNKKEKQTSSTSPSRSDKKKQKRVRNGNTSAEGRSGGDSSTELLEMVDTVDNQKEDKMPSVVPGTVKIIVQPPSVKVDPIVCSFPAGIPESVRQTSSRLDPPQFLWLQNQAPAGTTTIGSDEDGGATRRTTVSLLGKDAVCTYRSPSQPLHPDPTSTTTSRLCIGVYDKVTSQVTLYQAAAGGSVFTLQQAVPSYRPTLPATATTALPLAARQAQTAALYQEFGSAKKRRVLQSQEANRVDVVHGVVGAGQSLLDGIMAKPGTDGTSNTMSESNRLALQEKRMLLLDRQQQQQQGNSELPDNNHHQARDGAPTRPDAAARPKNVIDVTTEAWRRGLLPEFQAQATEPHLVYSARSMAGDAVWGYLNRLVDACLHQPDWMAALTQQKSSQAAATTEGEEEKDGADAQEGDAQAVPVRPPSSKPSNSREWSNVSVLRVLRMLPSDATAAKPQILAAVLLNSFFNLYYQLHFRRMIHSPETSTRSRFFGAPLELGQRFLELFATPVTKTDGETGYVMSKPNKERCHVHMLLLYMMAEGGKNMKSDDIKPLADELKIDIKDASRLLREAGCTVLRRTSSSGAVQLTAQLKTPLVFPPPKRRAGASKPKR